jgi:putative phosphoesterase
VAQALKGQRLRVGVISDTHSLLRPEAVEALRGAELILHAGDIGEPDILDALREIAPVVAVRGNNDHGPWARPLPERVELTLAGARVLMLHDVKQLGDDRADVVVAGHSHHPRIETRAGMLLFKPGSAGPRRFSLPITVGWLEIADGRAEARLVDLEVRRSPAPPRGRRPRSTASRR